MSLENSCDRSLLIQKIIKAAFDAAHGVQSIDEQSLMQTLGELVKSKLLTAEDSYALRDRLLDTSRFDKLVEARVKNAREKRLSKMNQTANTN